MPVEKTTVTIGGLPATIDFIGIPSGLVGVTQINFTIPSGASIGTQPVVVTFGGVRSAAAMLPPSTVTTAPVVLSANASDTKAWATSSAVTSRPSRLPAM